MMPSVKIVLNMVKVSYAQYELSANLIKMHIPTQYSQQSWFKVVIPKPAPLQTDRVKTTKAMFTSHYAYTFSVVAGKIPNVYIEYIHNSHISKISTKKMYTAYFIYTYNIRPMSHACRCMAIQWHPSDLSIRCIYIGKHYQSANLTEGPDM